MRNSTNTIVCHSGAISLRPGFNDRSVSAGVVAIFPFMNEFAIQNISWPPVTMRELRGAAPDSYGTPRVRAEPRRVLALRIPAPYASGLDISTKWHGNFDLI